MRFDTAKGLNNVTEEGSRNWPVESMTHRYEMLLEVSESIALCRDLPVLFGDLSVRLARVMRFDSLGLVLHDPERNTMRLHILQNRLCSNIDVIELPIEESPGGFVWQTQQPLVVPNTDEETRYPEAIALFRKGNIKSFCILPLTTAHRRLGALCFTNHRYSAYGEADLGFLEQVARQVAVAVDNALSHQESQIFQGQLQHERDRLRLLLDLNNSVVSNLDLR